MAEPARQLAAAPGRWHNELFPWILRDPHCRGCIRVTLQAIADECEKPTAEEPNLVGGIGGGRLWKPVHKPHQTLSDGAATAGVSRATFWRHLKRLEALGFVVALSRGGTLRRNGRAISVGNIYGIPHQRGALDHRRCRRRMQRMIPCADGKLRPHVTRPGDQATLWPNVRKRRPRQSKSETGVVSKRDGGSLKVRRGSSQSETVPYHGPSPGSSPGENHGYHGALHKRGCKNGKTWGRHVDPGELADPRQALALYEEAVSRGHLQRCEQTFNDFFAAIIHARRVANHNPVGLFVRVVLDGLWGNLSAEDERWGKLMWQEAHDRMNEQPPGQPLGRPGYNRDAG